MKSKKKEKEISLCEVFKELQLLKTKLTNKTLKCIPMKSKEELNKLSDENSNGV